MTLSIQETALEGLVHNVETGRLAPGVQQVVLIQDPTCNLWVKFPIEQQALAHKFYTFLQVLTQEELAVIALKLQIKRPVTLAQTSSLRKRTKRRSDS